MKIKIVLSFFICMCCFLSNVCSAVSLRLSGEVGSIWTFPDMAFVIENSLMNYGSKPMINGREISYNNGDTIAWEKGVALFGDVEYPLSFSYSPRMIYFSDKNHSKKVEHNVFLSASIYSVHSDAGRNLYLIEEFTAHRYGPHRYILCGYRQDGKFVIYFDTDKVISDYGIAGGQNIYLSFDKPIISGDFIKIAFNVHTNKYSDLKKDGEFNFVWNNQAQWFSVDYIKY